MLHLSRGTLQLEVMGEALAGRKLTWRGRQLSIEPGAALPSDDEFETRGSAFELSCTVDLKGSQGGNGQRSGETTEDAQLSASWLIGVVGRWRGMAAMRDQEHGFVAYGVRSKGPAMGSSAMGSSAMVSSCGANALFGRFVGAGVVDSAGGELILTVGRRYVAKDDSRAKWKIKQVTAAVTAAFGGDERFASEPWRVLDAPPRA